MKFTILGHACLHVEANGSSVLVDPWLVGSCYWGSWWNFPEADPALIRALKPDHVYLTHLHWDHFHGPSLRLLDPATSILVPRAPTTRMVDDLRAMGFENVHEIPHGDSFQLAPGFTLHSFQFGPLFVDSVAVITDGRTVLLDANDCKMFGLSLRQVTRRFPAIDFAFRSHSSASPFPHCFADWETRFAASRTKSDYEEEFSRFALAVGARHAIPFASNHCFVHRETVRYNDLAVLPSAAAGHHDSRAAALGHPSCAVVMAPGSSWSDRDGFQLRPFDYGDRDRFVAAITDEHRRAFEARYAREERARASFNAFAAYFDGLIAAVPAPLRPHLLPRAVFRVVESGGDRLWLLDGPAGLTRELGAIERCDFVIDVPALVLNDCCRKRMFSAWTPSKRLMIHLDRGGVRSVTRFFAVLDFYENDGLPLGKSFTRRQLGVRLRRWREVVDLAGALLRMATNKRFKPADLYASG